MEILGAITTGAGIKTQKELNFVPQTIQIGTIDTDLPIQGFSLTVDGDTRISIQNQARIQAFSKWMKQIMSGADVKVAMLLTVADGKIPLREGSTCSLVFENAGATTPAVYANWEKRGSRSFIVGEEVVIASSSKIFQGFEALFFDPTNIDYAIITSSDGEQCRYEVEELPGLFAKYNPSDADGKLAALTVVDNTDFDNNGIADIAQIELKATAGGNTTVLVARL